MGELNDVWPFEGGFGFVKIGLLFVVEVGIILTKNRIEICG